MGVVRCAEDWWRATDSRQANGRVLTAKVLNGAFDVASTDPETDLPEAGHVGAMLRSLKWAGWTALHATSFLVTDIRRDLVAAVGP